MTLSLAPPLGKLGDFATVPHTPFGQRAFQSSRDFLPDGNRDVEIPALPISDNVIAARFVNRSLINVNIDVSQHSPCIPNSDSASAVGNPSSPLFKQLFSSVVEQAA